MKHFFRIIRLLHYFLPVATATFVVLKQFVAILLCVTLFIQCMAHWAVVGLFQLNKDYIAKNLCENRQQPKKKCCGSCYLKKQLKKVDNQDDNGQSAPRTVKVEKSEWVAILPVSVPLIVATPPSQKLQHSTAYPEGAVVHVVQSIFHPPATIS